MDDLKRYLIQLRIAQLELYKGLDFYDSPMGKKIAEDIAKEIKDREDYVKFLEDDVSILSHWSE